MRVTDATGADLGPVYGFQTLPVISTNMQSVASSVSVSAASQSWVLVAEQPGGAGTERYLVWRSIGAGLSWPMDCLFGGPADTTRTIFYLGAGCTGSAYIYANALPVPGFACNTFLLPDRMKTHMVAAAAVPSPEVVVSWSSSNLLNCTTFSSQQLLDAVYLLTDLGPAVLPPAPLRIVLQ